MFGIDKLKLLIKIEDVEIINENAFTKKIKGDELVELTYKQETPFYLMIKINYRREEAIVEFTGKVLLSEYHNLIRLGNIRKCFDNINALGICKINNYIIADTLKCDIANDVNVPDVKTLSKFIYSNINSYQKFTPEYIKNGNFIVHKNVTTKQCKKRLTIYNKFSEMEMAKNRQFLKDYYDGENPFTKKWCRFEVNLTSQKQIRSTLNIYKTTLKSVLLAASDVNPIYDFLSEIISDEVAKVDDNTNKGKKGTAIRDYERYCTLLINDFDIQKLEAKIRPLCSKGTKVSPVINRYKEIMKEKELNQSIYTKEKILNLVKTETQITSEMRIDIFYGKLN